MIHSVGEKTLFNWLTDRTILTKGRGNFTIKELRKCFGLSAFVCWWMRVFDTETKIRHICEGIQSGIVSPSVRREKDIKRVTRQSVKETWPVFDKATECTISQKYSS